MNKQYVFKLFSRDSLKTMSKSKKKLYKLLLTALAANLFIGKMLHDDSKEIINELEKLLEETYNAETYDKQYEEYHKYLIYQFARDKVFKLTKEEAYQGLIEFTRVILNELIEKNVSVHTKAEIEKYVDINAYTKDIDESIRWIGINFETGLYPFIPEKFVWDDYKVIWNIFATYKKEALNNWINAVDGDMLYDRIHDKKTREIEYMANTMERSVLVSCITFAESFLYNIRIIIRDNPIFKKYIEDYNLEKVIQNDKINDMQIIEDILFIIYPQLKNIVSYEYKIYRELLKLRDRYIHISVRENGDRQPEMSSLLSSSGLNIEMKIKYALALVDKINNTILDSDKINMLWWRKDNPCNFIEFELYKIV